MDKAENFLEWLRNFEEEIDYVDETPGTVYAAILDAAERFLLSD